MAKRTGRPNRYITDVKPRFEEIKKWLTLGMPDKEIAENLGLGESTYYRYKQEHKEFRELIKKGRKKPVQEIKSALYRRAIGFQYTEIEEISDNEGYKRTKKLTKTALPDPASAMILLKHWDKDGGWTNDPQSLDLKKKELELKEKQMESEDW